MHEANPTSSVAEPQHRVSAGHASAGAPDTSGDSQTRRRGSSRYPDVLIADDDPTTVACVETTLGSAGISVVSAPTGRGAVYAARTLRPRLFILDVGMPDMDGLSICRQIRADPATRDTPVLFLSSSSSISARLAGLRAGGLGYLAKPFEEAELLAHVRAHLEAVSLREELNRRNAQLASVAQTLKAGLAAAERVQQAMLPRPDLVSGPVGFAWRYIPCEQLGGDAVNVLSLGDGLLGVYVLDASGHGLPAALLAVACAYYATAAASGAFRAAAGRTSPSEVLNGVNQMLSGSAPAGAFVTMLFGLLDTHAETFTFASAGHPGPVLFRGGAAPVALDDTGPPAGLCTDDYHDHVLRIHAGDRLLMYSDGIYEQRNRAGDQYGRERMMQLVEACRDNSPDSTVDQLIQSMALWRGRSTFDDDLSVLLLDCGSEIGKARGSRGT